MDRIFNTLVGPIQTLYKENITNNFRIFSILKIKTNKMQHG